MPGIRVGHSSDSERKTGCTVILFQGKAVGAVHVAGAAPATYNIESLHPRYDSNTVNAVVLGGGSNLGVHAAVGVQDWLLEQAIGWPIPMVRGAFLLEGVSGEGIPFPSVKAGYLACRNATARPVRQGNVGAGTGTSSGKIFGSGHATKTGVGSASFVIGDNLVIGALVVVNALGSVVDPRTSKIIAGARGSNGQLLNEEEMRKRVSPQKPPSASNTVLAVIATNGRLRKQELSLLAQMASAGIARTIYPAWTVWDGDIVFALSCGGEDPTRIDLLYEQAPKVLSSAILAAATSAESTPRMPAARDLQPVSINPLADENS